MIVGLVGLLLLLGLSGAAIAANATLSQTYSAQRAVTDYFAAQQRGDVNTMWANASFDRPDGSYGQFFGREALAAMMTVNGNSDLRDVRVTAVRDVDASAKVVTVGMTWAGTPFSRSFTVRADRTRTHWLLYPSWKVSIPATSIAVTLPNQAGPLKLDGRALPIASPPTVTAISGFHSLTIDPTALLTAGRQVVDARDATTATLAATLSERGVADAGTAMHGAFDSCDVTKYDGCFNHTYLARDSNYIYYMTVPGYGDVNYTKYSYALTGDPTAGMKLTVESETGKLSVIGSCTSTLTVNGNRGFLLKGDFSGTLHWNGAAFDSDVSWDCAKERA